MRRVSGRLTLLETRTRERGRASDGWRVVLGPFVGAGEGDLSADEAADLAAGLAATGERPTFAALIAACRAVVVRDVA
jgi:hypothetical protein